MAVGLCRHPRVTSRARNCRHMPLSFACGAALSPAHVSGERRQVLEPTSSDTRGYRKIGCDQGKKVVKIQGKEYIKSLKDRGVPYPGLGIPCWPSTSML